MSLDDEIIHIEDMPNDRSRRIIMVRDAATGELRDAETVLLKITRDRAVEADIFYDDGTFSRRHVEGIHLSVAADMIPAKEGQQQ